MANLLLVTSGLRGMLYSSLELGRRLERAGHDVTYASSAAAKEAVRASGLEFLELEPSEYQDFLDADRRTARNVRRRDRVERSRLGVKSFRLDRFSQDLREISPDLVLLDCEMHGHILTTLGSSCRVALLNSFVSIWRRPGTPPPHHLVRPGSGFMGTGTGMWLLWEQLRLRKRLRVARQRRDDLGCDQVSLLRLLAGQLGVQFDQEVEFGDWLIPFSYRRLPVLTLHAFEFEFPHDRLPLAHYVGPMLLEERSAPSPSLVNADAAKLAGLYESRKKSQGDRKLIYAGFGTFFTALPEFLERLVRCVELRPEWDLILSLGDDSGTRDLELPELPKKKLPKNVHLFSWVPQIEVLRQCDVAVVHGGANTTDECVLAGVPMLVFCGHATDMAGATSRVQFHGIGLAGRRARDTPQRIGALIDRLLKEKSFQEKIDDLRQQYLRYQAEGIAESVVESLLASSSSTNAP